MNRKLAALLVGTTLLGLSSVALAEGKDTPFVYATQALTEKFSPFFNDTTYDREIADLTSVQLLTTDRLGGIVENAIKGEDRDYNGTSYHYAGIADLNVNYDEGADITTYKVHIRDDVKFSDGEPLTADDIIFNYYVYLDPDYDGANTLRSYQILGLQDYRTQTSSEVFDRYAKYADTIAQKGKDYKPTKEDGFTEDLVKAYWDKSEAYWRSTDKAIVDEVAAKYSDAAADAGLDPKNITDADKPALGLVMWNLAKYDKDTGILHANKDFNIKGGERPTMDDFYAVTQELYKGNLSDYTVAENPAKEDLGAKLKEEFISEYGSKDETMGKEGVPNIAGIKKLDQTTVEVKVKGFSAPAVYQIVGIPVAPLHYYGDKAQYNYEENKFGHPFGDLKIVRSKTAKPMGAGPYKFIKYENRVVYFEANENYWEGAPKTKFVQFKETQTDEVGPGIKSGAVDAGQLAGGKASLELAAGYNSNKELSGDVLYVTQNDTLGYGYIGMNADRVNIGGGEENAGTEASKALRKGLATIIATYRNIAFDSYYGPAASVIQYPISNTSWAAPQPTDADYRPAFSQDADGNEIYTEDMDFAAREEAAIKAAISWFKKAGYTFDEAAGKFTKAPEGGRMDFEIVIGGGGKGDHPSFAVLTHAKDVLAKLGFELKINDPADTSIMWNGLDAGKWDMWCAAWNTTIDPDMYQIYHSSNRLGKPGSTNSNRYAFADKEADKLIVDARKSADQSYRKAIYKQILDIIIDWAVEIPCYQRKDNFAFSAERINIDSLAKDTTTFYVWMNEIHKIEMK